MTLDKKAVETISVNAVRNSIVTSPFLDQFIADNDKEPSWDGHVYIYEDASKRKNKLKGRLPVQVKGRVNADFSFEDIFYSIDVSDLRNYLYDGGAVLFVVYINNIGTATQIYYSELTPLKLRILLDEAKDQKTKTIRLKKFPTDGNKKATIFLNCLQNCQKQASFTDAKLYSLDELEKSGLLEGLTIPLVGVGVFDPQRLLLTSEAYLYANIKGSAIPQPVEFLSNMMIFTQEEIDKDVIIDDVIFYTRYHVIKSAEKTTVRFGESFLMIFENDKAGCKINYKNSSKIRVLVADLDFLLSYIEKGYFQVDGVRFPFDAAGANFKDFDIDRERDRLLFAKRSVKTLDMLGCREDIDLSTLSEEDMRNLIYLTVAFIDKEPISGLKPNLPPVLQMSIGDLKFALVFRKTERPGEYSVFDFFRSDINIAYEASNGEMIPTSQYAIFHADDLVKIQNIRPEFFLPSFQKVEADDKYTSANNFLLELLKAYDKSNDIRQDLLKAAGEFSKWLCDAPENYLDYHLRCLNRYQVLKRERGLNIDEIAELWKIVEDNTVDDIYKLGAYLLLDQQIPAEHHFEKLSKEMQNEFREYPIFRYFRIKED